MNSIFRFIILLAILGAFGALIQANIPASFGAEINGDIVYFLVAMLPMNFLIPMDTVFICLQILINFLYLVALFYLAKWLVHLTAQ